MVGEAARPQGIPFKQYMTLLDVMIAVGGLTDFADGNAATILRTSDGGKEGAGGKQYAVRLRDLIRRDMERRDGQFVQDAILVGYRDLAAGRVFASSGDFKTDMAVLDRKEADGW